jgi:hypothetical protein
MGNISGNAYALTVLSPIKNAIVPGEEIACADKVRDLLQNWNLLPNSPMTQVPQTYLCRYFVLDDVYTESLGGGGSALPSEDHLKSRYLVFSCNLHAGPNGDVDGYLRGMWNAISERIQEVWGYCYGFEQVTDADSFVVYMRKCMLPAALFFVGSNDDPLPEQLKALYIKQAFADFAVANQGLDGATVRANYQAFMKRVAPTDLSGPTWEPGKYRI